MRPSALLPRSGAFLSVAGFTVLWLLVGGGVTNSLVMFAVLALSGSWMLMHVMANGGLDAWRALPLSARLAVAFFCLMPLLQCVPLPPAIWHGLPGRALSAETLQLLGRADAWHPITLTFEATFRTVLLSVWLFALLLGVLRLDDRELRALYLVLLAMGAIHIIFGVVQLAAGGGSLLYGGSRDGFLLGLFANKNHSGLFMALTLLFGYVAILGERSRDPLRISTPLIAMAALVLLVLLILTFSRVGLVLGLAGLAFLFLLRRKRTMGRKLLYAILAGVAAVALLAVFASTEVASRSFGRFEGLASDPRWLFWPRSWELVTAYFPIGTGIGSFPNVFFVHERLEWVIPAYLNNAHNDYLEQLVEVGIAAPVLWALVALAILPPMVGAWRDRARVPFQIVLVGAAIVVLVLAHSLVDYPLRRPGLAAVFVIGLATLWRRPVDRKAIA